MTAMLAALVLLHKRLRLKRYCAIREYYEEQMRCDGLPAQRLCSVLT